MRSSGKSTTTVTSPFYQRCEPNCIGRQVGRRPRAPPNPPPAEWSEHPGICASEYVGSEEDYDDFLDIIEEARAVLEENDVLDEPPKPPARFRVAVQVTRVKDRVGSKAGPVVGAGNEPPQGELAQQLSQT